MQAYWIYASLICNARVHFPFELQYSRTRKDTIMPYTVMFFKFMEMSLPEENEEINPIVC